MNIESLGEGKIELLIDRGLVHTPADLYNLTYDDLLGIEKIFLDEETGKKRVVSFREKTVENILTAIERSKAQPFPECAVCAGYPVRGQYHRRKTGRLFWVDGCHYERQPGGPAGCAGHRTAHCRERGGVVCR